MAAPSQAFEIGVTPFYQFGWGNVTDKRSSLASTGRRLRDYGSGGVGAELDLGYRILPEVMVGVFAQATEFDGDSRLSTQTNVRSVAAGVQGNWFLRPYRTANPWLGLASAYRRHWIVPDIGGITQHDGWEIARVQVGVDLRASREVSVAPYVAASIDAWFEETLPDQESRALDGPAVSGFLGAGVLGRFDIGGTYTGERTSVARAGD
jgi:hypothetical protein